MAYVELTWSSALHPVILGAWTAWAALWIVVAPWTKQTRWREARWLRLLDAAPLWLCALLLMPGLDHLRPWPLSARFAPSGPALPLTGTVMVVAGLGLAVWARWQLGRNWSGYISVKEGHTLIRTGPYSIVRHPIYTGLLLAVLGTALAIGEWRGLVAFGFVVAGLWRRIVVEERHMGETFSEYDEYRRTTWALILGIF